MQPSYRRVKAACYATNVTMSVVGNLSPLLFLTFRSLYGFSYTQLGLLVLIKTSAKPLDAEKMTVPSTMPTYALAGASMG